MAVLASDIMLKSAGLLNDAVQALYTNAVLLPYLQKAYDDLQTELQERDVPVFNEISAILAVTAGTILLNFDSTPPLPANFLQPVKLFERATGSTDTFIPMEEQAWEPETRPGNSLHFWAWREEELHFVGALQNRDVKIRYYKGWADLVGVNSPIVMPGLRSYLESKTAAYAARYIGQNTTRAGQLEADAGRFLASKITKMVKNRQGTPVRRRGYGSSRRRTRVWPSQ